MAVTNPNPVQARAEAVAEAKAAALADPNSANSILAVCYDDHNWTKAQLDANTTEGIKNTLKAHAAAIQALADHIDGVNKHGPTPRNPQNYTPGVSGSGNTPASRPIV